jgi:hypothetical protein
VIIIVIIIDSHPHYHLHHYCHDLWEDERKISGKIDGKICGKKNIWKSVVSHQSSEILLKNVGARYTYDVVFGISTMVF